MTTACDGGAGLAEPAWAALNPELRQALTELGEQISPLFARPEPHQQAMLYVAGLLGRAQRKNSWQMAASTGQDSPWRMQRLLNRATWDADGVRDVVREFVVRRLRRPDGVLALGELGVSKKGTRSVGVARQYTEAIGQVENCQVGVVAAYVSDRGCSLIDRELYLPESWTADRCRRVGVPHDRLRHRSRAELATWMIARSRVAGAAFSWVTGGMAYGQDASMWRWLDAQRLCYVLAVPPTLVVSAGGARAVQVDSLAARIAPDRWERRLDTVGGRPVDQEWARISLPAARAARSGLVRSVLVRRDPREPSRLACYLARAPLTASVDALVAVAGAGQATGEFVRTATERVGMGSYEVRTWTAWYRHVTLAMMAMASLAAVRPQA